MKNVTEKLLISLVDCLCEISEKEEIAAIEKKFNVSIGCEIEKHNALQYTYYYQVEFDGVSELFCVEIESGINNGTVVLNEEWSEKTMTPCSKEVEVLVDVKPNIKKMREFSIGKKDIPMTVGQAVNIAKKFGLEHDNPLPNSFLLNALNTFEQKKQDILKLYSNQNYDDYVTGGGTTKTDKYYKDAFTEFRENGLFWDCVFKQIEVDRTFI